MAWKNVEYENGRYRTNSGGGGGSSTLAGLDDTNITSPTDGQTLRYNGTTQKWENVASDISPFSVVDGKVNITYITS